MKNLIRNLKEDVIVEVVMEAVNMFYVAFIAGFGLWVLNSGMPLASLPIA